MQQFPLLSVLPLCDAGDDVNQKLAIPLLIAELKVQGLVIHAVMDMLHQLLVQDVIIVKDVILTADVILLLPFVSHYIFVLLLTEVLGQVIADDDLMDGVIGGGHLVRERRGGITLARD